jgi:general secretion pathway protein N
MARPRPDGEAPSLLTRNAAPLVAAVALALTACPVVAEDAPPGAEAANPLAALSLKSLVATRERPLFSASRRPPALPPAPAARIRREPSRPPQTPPALTLIGVVLDAEEARAVVRTGTAIIRARIGDDIGGWSVTAIEPRRLVISSDDRSVSFALFGAEPAGARTAPGTASTNADHAAMPATTRP